jgi:hypothetical protein
MQKNQSSALLRTREGVCVKGAEKGREGKRREGLGEDGGVLGAIQKGKDWA